MLTGGVDAGADLGADHDRALCLPAEHVAEFGALVEDLVHAAAEEVDEHQLGDRSQTSRGRPDGGADETRLGDRGIQDPVATELLDETLGDAHRPAPGIIVHEVIDHGAAGDVLAQEDDGGILAHGDLQCLVDGLLVGHRARRGFGDHQCLLASRISVRARHAVSVRGSLNR